MVKENSNLNFDFDFGVLRERERERERERDLFCVRPKAVQTQSQPNNPAKMLDANPILAQTKGLVDQRQVSVFRN